MSKGNSFFILLLLFMTTTLAAQQTEMVTYDNELYMAYIDKIFKVDLDDTSPNRVDVITDLNTPTSLVFNGSDLYYVEQGKIYKADVTEDTPQPEELVINGLTNAYSIRFDGNNLMITRFGGIEIFMVDITDPELNLIDTDTGEQVTY